MQAKLHEYTLDFPDSNEYVQVAFLSELRRMKDNCHTQNQVAAWRKLLSLIVEKIVTTPIEDQAKGTTIEIKVAPVEGWAEFYRRTSKRKESS